ncbi:MAG: DUF4867 family protein [Oscillospiraceae bacterium]|nr:DUF4867 family protein [Oscillospiraceae bacterium]
MKILSITDPAFAAYGKIVDGYDWKPLLDLLVEITPKPEDRVMYRPGDEQLEALDVSRELGTNFYGGMPIQVGYCNGSNNALTSFEYHRDSEVNITADDTVLILARQQDIIDNKLDTTKAEAFLLPAGVAVELYATTLHYAPCNAPGCDGFRVIVVLPKGTNTKKPEITAKNVEDKMLLACNKWLITYPGTREASNGAYVGLTGEKIVL